MEVRLSPDDICLPTADGGHGSPSLGEPSYERKERQYEYRSRYQRDVNHAAILSHESGDVYVGH